MDTRRDYVGWASLEVLRRDTGKIWITHQLCMQGFSEQPERGLLFSRSAVWAQGTMICYSWEQANNTLPGGLLKSSLNFSKIRKQDVKH